MNKQQNNLLTNDHSKLDELLDQVFAALRNGDHVKALANLDYFWARLAMHIRAEHLHLFPILLQKAAEPYSLEGVGDILSRLPDTISFLRRDHDFFVNELGRCVNCLREQHSEKREAEMVDLGEIQSNLLEVAQRLEVHNELEEKEVYPLAQVLFNSEEIAALIVLVKRELANVPPRFRSHLSEDDNTK